MKDSIADPIEDLLGVDAGVRRVVGTCLGDEQANTHRECTHASEATD